MDKLLIITTFQGDKTPKCTICTCSSWSLPNISLSDWAGLVLKASVSKFSVTASSAGLCLAAARLAQSCFNGEMDKLMGVDCQVPVQADIKADLCWATEDVGTFGQKNPQSSTFWNLTSEIILAICSLGSMILQSASLKKHMDAPKKFAPRKQWKKEEML